MSLFAISHRSTPEVAEAVAAAVAAAEAAVQAANADARALDMSALTFSREVALRTGSPVSEVWQSLCHVPDNLLSLLESPEGWGVLSSHVAAVLGHEPTAFVPVIH